MNIKCDLLVNLVHSVGLILFHLSFFCFIFHQYLFIPTSSEFSFLLLMIKISSFSVLLKQGVLPDQMPDFLAVLLLLCSSNHHLEIKAQDYDYGLRTFKLFWPLVSAKNCSGKTLTLMCELPSCKIYLCFTVWSFRQSHGFWLTSYHILLNTSILR